MQLFQNCTRASCCRNEHYSKVVSTNLGVHWLNVLILPMVFFSWLFERENRFIPDEAKRKLYARSLIAGSIALAILMAWLRK